MAERSRHAAKKTKYNSSRFSFPESYNKKEYTRKLSEAKLPVPGPEEKAAQIWQKLHIKQQKTPYPYLLITVDIGRLDKWVFGHQIANPNCQT